MSKGKRAAAAANGATDSKQSGKKYATVTALSGYRAVFQDYLPQGYSVSYTAAVLAIAVAFGAIHGWHLSSMFENDRFFSHLSTLERELSFRTEMGLYYSYYKTMVQSKSFFSGLYSVMNDNVTEYPDTINTLKRFNLYPEVVLAASYRVFVAVTDGTKWKVCYTITRGHGQPPVESCVGIGDETYFYVNSIFFLNGILMSLFFLLAVYLSDSILGGVIATAAYFYNHSEATRVMWTPPLRESFSYPFLFAQMFCVTWAIRTKRPGLLQTSAVAITGILFMLPWQFAQFALLTQTVSLFGVYTFLYIGTVRLRTVLFGQAIALAVNYILQFGNAMLLTSYFLPCLISVLLVTSAHPFWEKITWKSLTIVSQWVLMSGGTLMFKFILSTLLQMKDDAHIGDILKAKFGLYKDFHTQLYTCAREFGFMEWEFITKTTSTLLLPTGIAVVILLICRLLYLEFEKYVLEKEKASNQDNSDPKKENKTQKAKQIPLEAEVDESLEPTKPMAALLYHLFQLSAFAVIAIFIMRLKLFFTPHVCLMTALLASKEVFSFLKPLHRQGIAVLVLALMSVQGLSNLQQQWSIEGEFNNANHEQLIMWIQNQTPPNAVFAGSMPVTASIKLSAERPIVNHPHYEDAGLRERTHRVYQIYSRKSPNVVHSTLRSLGVDYVILEDTWCQQRSREGCSMGEVWDLEDEENRGKNLFCASARQSVPKPFKKAFENDAYLVLRVSH